MLNLLLLPEYRVYDLKPFKVVDPDPPFWDDSLGPRCGVRRMASWPSWLIQNQLGPSTNIWDTYTGVHWNCTQWFAPNLILSFQLSAMYMYIHIIYLSRFVMAPKLKTHLLIGWSIVVMKTSTIQRPKPLRRSDPSTMLEINCHIQWLLLKVSDASPVSIFFGKSSCFFFFSHDQIDSYLHPPPNCRFPASWGSPGDDFLYERVRIYVYVVGWAFIWPTILGDTKIIIWTLTHTQRIQHLFSLPKIFPDRRSSSWHLLLSRASAFGRAPDGVVSCAPSHPP